MADYLTIAKQALEQYRQEHSPTTIEPEYQPDDVVVDDVKIDAGIIYCPGCKSEALNGDDDKVTCLSCKAWWIPSIDIHNDAPTATIRINHPAGHTVTIGIYRCPQCRETRWGPRLDNPAIWCCLTCAGQGAVLQKQKGAA